MEPEFRMKNRKQSVTPESAPAAAPRARARSFFASHYKKVIVVVGMVILGGSALWLFTAGHSNADLEPRPAASATSTPVQTTVDTVAYDKKMLELANNPQVTISASSSASSTATTTVQWVTVKGKDGKKHRVKKVVPVKPAPAPKPSPWPVKGLPYPNVGALLPFNRIVAFYGNFYSKNMGILGEYPADDVVKKLKAVTADWESADLSTPVIPAIHYIATTAQKYPGADKKHILRMPTSQLDKALAIAAQAKAITFFDIQPGKSTVQDEVPLLKDYLKRPDVHLGIDPEFAMKSGKTPGTVVGTLDATDINWVITYLAGIVKENKLPPKILVIHRFTQDAVTHYEQIKPVPEVQVVMDMDGWGSPDHKLTTYRNIIYPEPVQFTGFKVFYKNDLRKPSKRLMTPSEILKLRPIPSYIQYQ